jgi:hypothetical protein
MKSYASNQFLMNRAQKYRITFSILESSVFVLEMKQLLLSDCFFRAERTETFRQPDGLFAYQKSKFWYILEGLGLNNFGIFFCHLVYFWLFGIGTSWIFGKFCVIWYS